MVSQKMHKKKVIFRPKKSLKKGTNMRVPCFFVIDNNDNKMITFSPNKTRGLMRYHLLQHI